MVQRKASRGDTSRMNREVQVRICEGLGVKIPGPTRQSRHFGRASGASASPPKATKLPPRTHRRDGPSADHEINALPQPAGALGFG
jgi:hypothetical protein